MSTSDTQGFTDALVRWNERFAQPGYLFGLEPNAFLLRQSARLRPGSRILCVADGEGRNSTFLAAQGHAVTAFDLSPVAVEKARALAAQRGVEVAFNVAGTDTWEWAAERYDAVAAIFVQFAPPAERQALFAGMWRTLRHDGLLLIQGYTPGQLEYRTGGPGKLEYLYTADLLRGLLPQAQWLELTEHEAVLAEGSAHHGHSALIDAVARKG
ncbi:MAG: SAM-dependent methyltransferase [Steroidobacteraceae bacterium]